MLKEKQIFNLTQLLFWLLITTTLSLVLEYTYVNIPANRSEAGKLMAAQQNAAQADSIHIEETNSLASIQETGQADVESQDDSKTAMDVQAASASPDTPDFICYNINRGGIADRKEKDVLIHLINAEAYGLSYKAKVAVGQVVMNRWKGPYYGDNLLAIMTAPHQFTPIYDGSAYNKTIEPDSIEAANAVLNGNGVKELTDDTYYFVNPDFTEDKTIENTMEFVCEIEGIHFFKPPTES